MADWNKIKTEYITTDTSYRKLAEKEWEEYEENLQELKRILDLAHLKRMLKELSDNRTLKFNLRKGPLSDKSPSDISDMLETLGWESEPYDSNGWEQDTWISFAHEAYSFCLTLAYSGYYWTMKLYRSDIDD